jgi:ferritin-like metal-binding protein YciE
MMVARGEHEQLINTIKIMATIIKKKAVKTKKKDGASEDLRDLFNAKIGVLYGMEIELLKALPVMAKKANDVDLKEIFGEHVGQLEDHVKRLVQICELLGVKAQKVSSHGIHGLLVDVEETMKNVKIPHLLDAALVAAVSAIERYKMVSYESAIVWAKLLEKDKMADLLEQTLDEECDIYEELDDIAELKIYERALPESSAKESNTKEGSQDDDEEEDDDMVIDDENGAR